MDVVVLAAGEPGGPLRPAREIDDLLVRRIELEIEVLDRRIPEPGRIVRGAGQELREGRDALLPHEAQEAAAIEVFLRRTPDDVRTLAVLSDGHRSRIRIDFHDPSLF